MKTSYRAVVSSIILVLFFGLSMAQDETRFPPMTPENRGQREMIQALSNGEPHQLEWSPDSEHLAVTATGGTWVYDIEESDTPSHHLKDQDLRSYVAFAPYHDIYVSYTPLDFCPMGICEGGQQALIHDANTHEVLHQIRGTWGVSVEFSPDGSLLAIAGVGYGIMIWRTDSFRQNIGKKPSEFMQCHIDTSATPIGATFSPDGSLITYGGWRPQMASPGDDSVWFWDTQTCEVHLEVQVYPHDSQAYPPPTAYAEAYSQNGQYAVIGSLEDNQALHLWNVITGADLGRLPDMIQTEPIWNFTPDSQNLLLYNNETSEAKIWHIESQTVTRTFTANRIMQFDDTSLLIIRDGDVYRITETDETLLWDDELAVSRIWFTDDKQWIIINHDKYKTVLLDVETQTIVHEWEFRTEPVISADKSKMAWANRYTIQIFDFADGQQSKLNNFIAVGSDIVWSATDETMLTYSNSVRNNQVGSDISIFDVWVLTDTGFEHRWRNEDGKTAILEVADDFISLMNEGTVEFWDVMTGDLLATRQPSVCEEADESDPFCTRWLSIIATHEAQEISQYPVAVSLSGNVVTVAEPTQTYTLPDHIATQLSNARTAIEWAIAPNGDVLMKFDLKVYNVTQDTMMQIGWVRVNAGWCRDGCNSYDIRHTRFNEDATVLLGSGRAEDPDDPRYEVTVLTGWDIQTGRWIYNIEGNTIDDIRVSDDGQYVFRFGNEYYWGGGRTVYNRYAGVYDARTGEAIVWGDTYAANAYSIDVSPNRRFVVIHSDNSRVWGVVNP